MSAYQYVVTHAFNKYEVGDHITDIDEINKWSVSHPAHLVRKPWFKNENPGPLPPVSAEEPPAASGEILE